MEHHGQSHQGQAISKWCSLKTAVNLCTKTIVTLVLKLSHIYTITHRVLIVRIYYDEKIKLAQLFIYSIRWSHLGI